MDIKQKRDTLHQILDTKIKLLTEGLDTAGLDTTMQLIFDSIQPTPGIELPDFMQK